MKKTNGPLLAGFLLLLLAGCGGGGGAAAPQSPAPAPVTPAPPSNVAADAEYEPVVQQIYVGYFGRPADPAELARDTAAYRSIGAPKTVAGLKAAYSSTTAVRDLVDSLALTQESKDLYPSSSYIGDDYTFITAVYENLYSRKAAIEDAEFWATRLAGHQLTRPNAVLSLLADSGPGDAATIATKTEAARNFTNALNTAERRNAYAGHVSHAVARSMLQVVPATADPAARQAIVDAAIRTLVATANGEMVEQKGPSRKIALVAAADQVAANGDRLAALAVSLAADLNDPRRPNGPSWRVDVVPAAATVVAVRAQINGYQGAILVGNVPIPTFDDIIAHEPAPALDPYRSPNCAAFKFTDSGNDLANRPQLTLLDPACRNGLIVSELRGISAATQLADVAKKLDQMIAYHRASQSRNANWSKAYKFIEAAWFGGLEWPDMRQYWNNVSLYAANALSYLMAGNGNARRSAFLDCISTNNEMCIYNGHGSPKAIGFEGPGTPGSFYSSDYVSLGVDELAAYPVKAKYISLVSCSTQNFIDENTFGTTLLMSGDALLTHGMVAVSFISSAYEEEVVADHYAVLAAGGTFADAYLGKMEYSPANFQGDPYITMRPVPSGPQPVLVIDGKHYNGPALVFPLELPDSVNGMTATKVLSISNRGNADLHLKVRMSASNPGVGFTASTQGEFENGFNAEFRMASLSQSSGPAIIRGGPDTTLTVKPGGSVALTYSLTPNIGSDKQIRRRDLFSSTFELSSDDPAAVRLILEARGRVR